MYVCVHVCAHTQAVDVFVRMHACLRSCTSSCVTMSANLKCYSLLIVAFQNVAGELKLLFLTGTC